MARPTLDELEIADEPEAWRAAGFTVGDDGTCCAGSVRIRLVGRDDGRKGVRSWALRDCGDDGDIDGIPTRTSSAPPANPATHPNGTLLIDHVVVATPDIDRTVAALRDRGFEPRRERRTGTYGAPMRQVFFRMGEVILEVVGPGEAAPGEAAEGEAAEGEERPARFFGLAMTVDDLDATAALLAGHLGEIKDAVQPGRRIVTLRHKELGLSTAIAFMSPGEQEYS